jgi:hypothetical protein
MKYIKTYKIFERVSKETKIFVESLQDELDRFDKLDYGLIKDMKDILLPLLDDGIEITDCDYFHDLDGSILIGLNLMTSKERAFDINDYRSDIDMLISYMKSNNYYVKDLKVGVVEKKETWAGIQLLAYSQFIMSENDREPKYDKVNLPVFWISGVFIERIPIK